MMNNLIQDAVKLLQDELSPVAGITADGNTAYPLLLDAAGMLENYVLPPLRASRILALYFAITLAMQSHNRCDKPGKASTRRILDGDYLYSLYLQTALKWEEFDLIATLAPYIKNIQIKRAEGISQDGLLLEGLSAFAAEECKTKHNLAAEAI